MAEGSSKFKSVLSSLRLCANDHLSLAKALLSERIPFYQIIIYILKDMILVLSQL